MYYPDINDFNKLKTGSYVSIFKELPADDLTPVSVYENLGTPVNSFLLESAQKHEKTGKYSLIGFSPYLLFKSKNKSIEIIKFSKKSKKIYTKNGSPLKELQKLLEKKKTVKLPSICPFQGGCVGYFGYETVHFFENIPLRKSDDLNLPDLYFLFFDNVIIFDHFKNKIQILKSIKISQNKKKSYENCIESLNHIEKLIRNNTYKEYTLKDRNINNIDHLIISNYTKTDYIKMVEKTKEYICAGDIFQANLSQRFSTNFSGTPFLLYKTLREINPSPFACFFNFKDFQVVSSSPERLIKLENQNIETRPIAGTRPRGDTTEEDNKLSKELMLSPKERAEHIMLVDLERNDLGRVCEYGTVHVDELMVLEKYSHVIHIVSNIKGKLKIGKNWIDILQATFPGGTITGTPKVRCMEIIEELENVNRYIYTGSAGYISFTGDLDFNILIRTIIIKDGNAYMQAGGGIVADSIPEKEYYETLYKAQALINALKIYKKQYQQY
ncbi:MAG: anthranilate synthase component I [Candidatus Firestonebacteria bacterium]|nr:anthranilate synthase component I [Candidatus Firestonebacteria bacterium]